MRLRAGSSRSWSPRRSSPTRRAAGIARRPLTSTRRPPAGSYRCRDRSDCLVEPRDGGRRPSSDADVRAYYVRNRDRFRRLRRDAVRHILRRRRGVGADGSSTDADGEDMARAWPPSDVDRRAAAAARGGELGDVHRGELSGPLEDAIFAASRCGRSVGPIQTEHGWHVARVEAAGTETRRALYDEARPDDRGAISWPPRGPRVRRVARGAARGDLAVIEPGFEHPAASDPRPPEPPALTGGGGDDDQDRGDRRERQGGSRRGARPRSSTATTSSTSTSSRPSLAEAPFLRADLTDLGETIEALRGADAVVHLAAIPAPPIRTVERTFEINILSTYNVFSAAALLGLERVVWASSETVLGLPFGRSTPRNLLDPAAGPGHHRRARLRPDRRGASASTALELLAVQGPRRGDGAAVRPLERTSRSSACASRRSASRPSTRPSPTPGAIRIGANGTCGATSTLATSRRRAGLRLTRRRHAAPRRSSSPPRDTVMDRPEPRADGRVLPVVPSWPGHRRLRHACCRSTRRAACSATPRPTPGATRWRGARRRPGRDSGAAEG